MPESTDTPTWLLGWCSNLTGIEGLRSDRLGLVSAFAVAVCQQATEALRRTPSPGTDASTNSGTDAGATASRQGLSGVRPAWSLYNYLIIHEYNYHRSW